MGSIKKKIVEEIHKQARRHFPRRKIVVKSIRDLFQCDLIDMTPYAKDNTNYKYVLIVIDCFSKMVYAEAMKTKRGSETAEAMRRILKRSGKPRLVQSDLGTEFYSPEFRALMKEFNIRHYSTYSVIKASMAERVIRTIKGRLFKEFSYLGSYRWIDILKDVVNSYNNTRHRTIGMKPNEVNKDNEQYLLRTVYARKTKIPARKRFLSKLGEGEHVRISRYRHVFAKSYHPGWTTEIFKIRKVQQTTPVSYLLEDMTGKPIEGAFYAQELQRTRLVNDYLIEKVLRKRGDELYVKWLGFGDEHNSWISKNDVL
jgi:hypothetical protein